MDSKTSLKELAGFFARLGFTDFGGPAAHIALMQKEVVDRRGWMDHQHFLDLVGAVEHRTGGVGWIFTRIWSHDHVKSK